MTKLEQKLNKISFGWVFNLIISLTWLVVDFINYANYEEKLEVGTLMWVCLSIYILIRKLGGKL